MYRSEGPLLVALLCIYLLSSAGYIVYAAIKKEKLRITAFTLQTTGLLLHLVILVLRGYHAGRIPLVYSYEFASAFSLCVCLLTLLFMLKNRFYAIGSFAMPLVSLLLLYAFLQNRTGRTLMPALNSNWLVYHVSTVIVAYSAFSVAFVISLMYLLRDKVKADSFWDRRLPTKTKLDILSYRAARLGLVFLTVTIILGALWAEQAWGNYWTWDPKETWSLVTWLVYAMYLHLRMGKGIQGKTAAVIAVVGFLCVLFTYFGVNLLLPGLHSYA